MGATGISKTVETTNIKGVWQKLHDTARDRWSGEDYCEDYAYSGDWNTVSLGKIKKVLDKYSPTKAKAWCKKNLDKTWDDIYKRDSITLDFGVVGYEVWTVKKSCPKDKKAPKYETKFVIYHRNDMGRIVEDGSEKTATLANSKAMKLTMDTGGYYYVKKTRVLVSGNEDTATFSIVKKSYKSKPKSVKKGGVLKEVHHYEILGVAAD